jgi:hypothetical protein
MVFSIASPNTPTVETKILHPKKLVTNFHVKVGIKRMVAPLETEFVENGKIWLKKVLPDNEVDNLREEIFQIFDAIEKRSSGKHSFNMLGPSITYWKQEIWEILFKEKLINALKTILEPEYYLIPDLHIQMNAFGLVNSTIFGIPIPNKYGWHIDAGSESISTDHLDPEYRLVKCGLYLQDNTPEYGGGIDIVPKSHKFPVSSGFSTLDWQARRIRSKLGILFGNKTLTIKKGDMVIFHSFLMHSGTHPRPSLLVDIRTAAKKNRMYSLPREHSKIVVYFNACRKKFATNFLRHNLAQAQKQVARANMGNIPRGMSYCDEVSLQAAKGFPENFTELLRKNGIYMASLEGSELKEGLKLRQEAMKFMKFE